jgi:hypothetical protein
MQALLVLADFSQPMYVSDVDQAFGRGNIVFHQIQQIDASGFEHRV